MKLKFYIIACLAFALYLPSQAQLVINEISYNPPESGTDSLEFLEILNSGSEAVDISGYHFIAGVQDTVPEGVTLEPGAYYVFCERASAMMAIFGIVADQWTDGALGNGGETVTFADAAGNAVDEVTYDDQGDWPTQPDGNGPSLELISPELDNSLGSNWQASTASTGIILNGEEVRATPGALNSMIDPDAFAEEIETKNLKFIPRNVVVKLTDKINWFNNEGVPHNVNGNVSNYPGNPESFFSGAAASGPWEWDFEFNTAGFYDYHCDPHLALDMKGTVAVYDPNGYTPFTIPQIKLADDNAITIFDEVPTQFTGVVHGINYQPSGMSFYLLNDQNQGINIFSFDQVSNYTVTEGDMLTVWGVIDQFRGLIEIFPDTIDLLSSGNALNDPIIVSVLTEELESSFVVTDPVVVDSVGNTSGGGTNVYVFTYGTGNEILVRLDDDAGIDPLSLVEGTTYTIAGLVSQSDFSSPFTEFYQLLPRGQGDIMPTVGVPTIEADAIKMFPNPTEGVLHFKSDFQITGWQVFNTSGQLLKSKQISTLEDQINLGDVPSGVYMLKVKTIEGEWQSRFVKH